VFHVFLNKHSCEAAACRKAEVEVSEANMRARVAERAKFDAENAQLAAEALRDRFFFCADTEALRQQVALTLPAP
jgi:hypothetical protein